MEYYDSLIKNGTAVLENSCAKLDIAVRDGVITLITPGANIDAGVIIDASGMMIFPGAVDTHAHIPDPGPANYREDWRTGSWAAASGGFTTLVDLPNISPEVINCETLIYKEKIAAANSVLDYSFMGAATLLGASNVRALREMGCIAFKAFTVSTGSPDFLHLSSQEQIDMMEIVRDAGGIMAFHAEDDDIVKKLTRRAFESGKAWNLELHDKVRPYYAELAAIANVIMFAKHTGCPVQICHLSIPEGAELIKRAKAEGVNITAESCTHYLTLNYEDNYDAGSYACIMPPLRKKERMERLWSYLFDGTIDYLGTDHGQYSEAEKEPADINYWRIPGGAPGFDIAFPLIVDEAINKRGMEPWKLAWLTSLNGAKRFGFYPKKGCIQNGADADLAIFDMNDAWVYSGLNTLSKIKSAKYAYEGRKVGCKLKKTILRGKVIFDNGRIVAPSGCGQWVKSQR